MIRGSGPRRDEIAPRTPARAPLRGPAIVRLRGQGPGPRSAMARPQLPMPTWTRLAFRLPAPTQAEAPPPVQRPPDSGLTRQTHPFFFAKTPSRLRSGVIAETDCDYKQKR